MVVVVLYVLLVIFFILVIVFIMFYFLVKNNFYYVVYDEEMKMVFKCCVFNFKEELEGEFEQFDVEDWEKVLEELIDEEVKNF